MKPIMVVLAAVVATACVDGPTSADCVNGFQRAAGNIEIGSRLHYGRDTQFYWGMVTMTESDAELPDGTRGRALVVTMPEGEQRTLARKVILQDTMWVVSCSGE